MGATQTHEEEEIRVYDTRKLYYDQDGNVRYDPDRSIRSLDAEVTKIMEYDALDSEAGKRYCAIDTAWVDAWLAYTYYIKDVSPNPGPCSNLRLIIWDETKQQYVMKEGVTMASPTFRGDYRRISMEAWEVFKTNYPGCGPTITFEFAEKEGESKSRILTPTNWRILDPPPNPLPKPKHTRILSVSIDSITGLINNLRSPKPSIDHPVNQATAGERSSLLALSQRSEMSRNAETVTPKQAIVKPKEDEKKKYQDAFFPDSS